MNQETMNGEAGRGLGVAPCSAIGELVVWEEEGGYCTPAIRLKTTDGEVSLDEMVEKLIPGIEMGGGSKGVIIEVTMRIISPNAPHELPANGDSREPKTL